MNLKHTGDIFYNYIYCDPRKLESYKVEGMDIVLPAEPFYVGRGQKERKDVHVKEVTVWNIKTIGRKGYKFNKIKAIIEEGLEPIIVKLNENLSNERANEIEIALIKAIGRFDLGKGPLTNLTNGGGTSAGYKMSQEALQKNRASKIKNGTLVLRNFLGKKHTEESKEKNRQAHLGKPGSRKGKKATPEQILRNRLTHLGKKQSKETIEKRKLSCKKTLQSKTGNEVLRFDLQGSFIKEYRTYTEAFNQLGGAIFTAVEGRGKVTQANDSIWIYKKKWIQLTEVEQKELLQQKLDKANSPLTYSDELRKASAERMRRSMSKQCMQLNPVTLEVLQTYPSITKATEETGLRWIAQAIRYNRVYGNSKWKV